MTSTGKITISFVTSKSRIFPTKKIDVPIHRLELPGNLVLSKLMVNALSALQNDIVINSVYCLTDSRTALVWICSIKREFETSIPNRVSSIRKNLDYPNWRYCKTEENLADIITRVNKNFEENLWWYGLFFMRDKNSFYSYATTIQEDSPIEEEI